MAATNFHPVQPIVKAVETVGEKPPCLKPAPSARALKTTTKHTRNPRPKETSTKNPRKNPTVRKTKNTKPVEETPGKAHPPQRPLTIPNCKHHRTVAILKGNSSVTI